MSNIFTFIALLIVLTCSSQTTASKKAEQEVYINPEVKAEFPGGIKQFYSFIMNEIVLPGIQQDIQLKAYFSFTVTTEGELNDVVIIKDPGYEVGEELLRVLKLSPKWNPATHHGLIVASKMTLPITLSIKAKPDIAEPKVAALKTHEDITKPLYPGGDEKFHEDFFRNFNMPESTVRIREKVVLGFTVQPDGSMSHIVCMQDPGHGLGNEAVKALKLLKRKWIPANRNGEPVAFTIMQGINITVEAGSGPKKTVKRGIIRDTGPKHNFYDTNLKRRE